MPRAASLGYGACAVWPGCAGAAKMLICLKKQKKKPEIARSRAKSTKGGGWRRQPWHVGLRGPFGPSRSLIGNQSATSDNCSLSPVFVQCKILLLQRHNFVVSRCICLLP